MGKESERPLPLRPQSVVHGQYHDHGLLLDGLCGLIESLVILTAGEQNDNRNNQQVNYSSHGSVSL